MRTEARFSACVDWHAQTAACRAGPDLSLTACQLVCGPACSTHLRGWALSMLHSQAASNTCSCNPCAPCRSTNKLMKRLEQLKREKQALANEVCVPWCVCVRFLFDTRVGHRSCHPACRPWGHAKPA